MIQSIIQYAEGIHIQICLIYAGEYACIIAVLPQLCKNVQQVFLRIALNLKT